MGSKAAAMSLFSRATLILLVGGTVLCHLCYADEEFMDIADKEFDGLLTISRGDFLRSAQAFCRRTPVARRGRTLTKQLARKKKKKAARRKKKDARRKKKKAAQLLTSANAKKCVADNARGAFDNPMCSTG